MVKVQKVGNVVGWIVSVVWIVFLILLITTYANESAFVRVIHTILLPFGDINLNLCKDFAIAFCGELFIWDFFLHCETKEKKSEQKRKKIKEKRKKEKKKEKKIAVISVKNCFQFAQNNHIV